MSDVQKILFCSIKLLHGYTLLFYHLYISLALNPLRIFRITKKTPLIDFPSIQ